MSAPTDHPPPSEFIKRFHILSNANVGVMLVRTKEVVMTLDALRNYAVEKNGDFKFWTHVVGWESLATDENKAPERDRNIELYDAMKLVGDVDNDGKAAWPKKTRYGVYAMVYPHWGIPQLPAAIQLLKDYVYSFSDSNNPKKARLVLIVPEGFKLPAELESDIISIDYNLPNAEERRAIFDRVVTNTFQDRKKPEVFQEEDKVLLVNLMAGMTEMEAEGALARALASFRPYSVDKDRDDYKWLVGLNKAKFIEEVNKIKTEIIGRSECLSIMKELKEEDVAGLDLLKDWLKKTAASFEPDAAEFGLDRPKGIFLVGPPGTGKSMSVRLIGTIFKQRVIRLDMGAIFSKFVGSSEERIRQVIKLAKAMAPVVLVIDEIDKAGGGPKDQGGHETTRRVMGTLMTEMQECEEPVFWAFTGNWPDRIDPALLRKGRLDEMFSLLAATSVEREAVIRVHLTKRKQPVAKIDMAKVVEATKGFVSAEIEAIVKEAVKHAYSQGKRRVITEDIIAAADSTKPLCVAFEAEFHAMETWAKNFAKPSSTPDPLGSPVDAIQSAIKTRQRSL